MAMNLRLRPDAEEALRVEAARSQRSQQDVLRAAVDRYLGLGGGEPTDRREAGEELYASGLLRRPRVSYRKVSPAGDAPNVSGATLLDRDDRI